MKSLLLVLSSAALLLGACTGSSVTISPPVLPTTPSHMMDGSPMPGMQVSPGMSSGSGMMPGMSMSPGMHMGAEEDVAIPEGAKVIKVTGEEFTFAPKDIEVKAGEPVAVSFTNDGTTAHDWTVHDTSGAEIAHAHAEAGERAVAVFTPEAGTYEVWCTFPGHKEAGMVGTVTAA